MKNNDNRNIFTEKINNDVILKNFKKYLLDNENDEIRKMKNDELLSKNFNKKKVIDNFKIQNIVDNCKYIEMYDGMWFDNYGNIHITLYYNDDIKKSEFLTQDEYIYIKSLYHKEIFNKNNNTVQIFFQKNNKYIK